MPRVLRLINRLNLGGPTYNAAYLTRYLSPEFETLLVAGMIDESEASSEFVLQDMGLKPVYIPEMYRKIDITKDSRAYFRLKKIIRDFKPDIVHTHAAKAGALGRMAASACDVPVIVHTFHGHVFHSYFSNWKSKVFVNIERMLARRSNRIIAISQRQKAELSEDFRICPAEKIEVIPLGFDLKKFSENKQLRRGAFREAYEIDDDEIVISIIGRLVPVKNHRLFLRAVANLIKRSNRKLRFFIVGDGEERSALENIARSLSLDVADAHKEKRRGLITFTSWIKDVADVNAGSDIIALSSLNEGTPVSIIEALAAGKPVVTTNVGGISDFVFHGKNGLIAPSDDLDSFTDALYQLIENDSLRMNMQNFSEESIQQRFSYFRLIEDMKQLYNQLLSN